MIDNSTVNGHAYPPTADDVVSGSGRGGSARYPHVVGYYEVDSRVKKDCKVGHHYSVDWLRDAVGRITLVSTSSRQGMHATGCRIPRSWYSATHVVYSENGTVPLPCRWYSALCHRMQYIQSMILDGIQTGGGWNRKSASVQLVLSTACSIFRRCRLHISRSLPHQMVLGILAPAIV